VIAEPGGDSPFRGWIVFIRISPMLSIPRRSTALMLIMLAVMLVIPFFMMLGVGIFLVFIPLFAAVAVVLKPR
jgi:hypothetical protein